MSRGQAFPDEDWDDTPDGIDDPTGDDNECVEHGGLTPRSGGSTVRGREVSRRSPSDRGHP